MKNIFCLSGLILLLLSSCTKQDVASQKTIGSVNSSFTKYFIRQGQQFCDQNKFSQTNYSELKFIVKFDSTAIYKTIIADNQYDINKLYGFSDNNAQHQQFSARFGWRWSDNALRLFGYVYNNSIRDSKELGTIKIGAENTCSIKVTPTSYIFSMNEIVDSLPRTSVTPTATGYKLYPYFGGDEYAPHDISIWIREL